jgi:hypothetical protein
MVKWDLRALEELDEDLVAVVVVVAVVVTFDEDELVLEVDEFVHQATL